MMVSVRRFRDLLLMTLQIALLGGIVAPLAIAEQPGEGVESVEGVEKKEHPLIPVLKIAEQGLKHIDADIIDYSATLVKKERVKGRLTENQYLFVKIRHKPFSTYTVFLGPEEFKGREVIYVEGQNGGKLLAHEGRGWKARIGMVALKPDSPFAMEGQRYPITMMGMRTLTQRLMEVGQQDLRYDEVEVKIHKGTKINGRPCSCIQAIHPFPRKHFRYHLARIFIDDELQMPVRFEAFLWPYKKNGKPVLVEQYTYVNIKINNGFTDKDFDPQNEKYKFVRSSKR